MSKHAWKPLRRAPLRRLTDEHVAAAARATGQDEGAVRGALAAEADLEYWVNDLYQVAKRPLHDAEGAVRAYHLNIRRRGRQADLPRLVALPADQERIASPYRRFHARRSHTDRAPPRPCASVIAPAAAFGGDTPLSHAA